MLEEPYHWIEAIRNRREYVEEQLRAVSPVVGLAYGDGVLLLTGTSGPRKLFEVYDRVAFAGVGHPADLEKLRKATIDIAHLDGYTLSPADVTLHRLVSAGLGPLVRAAFDGVLHSPFTARVLMAELDPPAGGPADGARFFTVEPDGAFAPAGRTAAVAGSPAAAAAACQGMVAATADLPLDQALAAALAGWAMGSLAGSGAEADPRRVPAALPGLLEGQRLEAAVLDRSLPTRTKFRRLPSEEVLAAVASLSSGIEGAR
jgi:proteasome alpha subunit